MTNPQVVYPPNGFYNLVREIQQNSLISRRDLSLGSRHVSERQIKSLSSSTLSKKAQPVCLIDKAFELLKPLKFHTENVRDVRIGRQECGVYVEVTQDDLFCGSWLLLAIPSWPIPYCLALNKQW